MSYSNGSQSTDKLLKFLQFAVLTASATIITYVMTTSLTIPPTP